MLYRIVESFGPESGEAWADYLKWRGLSLHCFESVDTVLRPSLFSPETALDWEHCVQEDCKIDMLTDLPYAQAILRRYDNAEIVGIVPEVDRGYVPEPGLAGYDVMDGFAVISLLTDWGADEERQTSPYIGDNGLVHDLERALAIRDRLRAENADDSHAKECCVWAVYRVV